MTISQTDMSPPLPNLVYDPTEETAQEAAAREKVPSSFLIPDMTVPGARSALGYVGRRILPVHSDSIWWTLCDPAEFELRTKVVRLACKAHKGQFRSDGFTPYITHPEAVAARISGDLKAELAAWLHDVLEDNSEFTAKTLLDAGVPEDVVSVVQILTKHKHGTYSAYLIQIKENPIARKVKVADILHNLSSQPTDTQIIKYAKALIFLFE